MPVGLHACWLAHSSLRWGRIGVVVGVCGGQSSREREKQQSEGRAERAPRKGAHLGARSTARRLSGGRVTDTREKRACPAPSDAKPKPPATEKSDGR